MRKYLTYAGFAVLGIALIVFLVANRQPVRISLDPFSVDDPAVASAAMPLWAALVFTLTVGFVLGAFGMWLSNGSLRRKAKERRQEIKRLQHELKLAAGEPQENGSRLPALRS